MNRTGLIIALALAAVVGLLFGLFPQLDLPSRGRSTRSPMPPQHVRLAAVPASDAHSQLALKAGLVLVAPAVIALSAS